MEYLQLEAILALLIKETDTMKLFKIQINILIQAAKIIDQAVIDTKILEH